MKRVLVGVVVALAAAAAARAQPAPPEPGSIAARYRDAEALEQTASRTDTFEAWQACGEAYSALVADARQLDRVDEVLYDAAICFVRAPDPDRALAAFEALAPLAPRSRLAVMALWQTARLRASMVDLAGAARDLEQLAIRYGAEEESRDALYDAVIYRLALGDSRAAIADADYLIRKYVTDARTAGELMVGLAEWLRDHGDAAGAEKMYRRYLKEYGGKDDDGRVIWATVALGELAWRRACPVATIDGLCVRAARPDRLPRCTDDRPPVAVARRSRDAREAGGLFAIALRRYQQRMPDDPRARAAVGRARLHQAEAAIEALLAIAPPAKVRTGGYAVAERFQAWRNRWQAQAQVVDRAIEDVLDVKDPRTAVHAIMLAAVAYTAMDDTLESFPEPSAAPRGKEVAPMFCESLAQAARPVADKAADAAAACLQKANELSIVDDATATCVRLLDRWKPELGMRMTERVPAMAPVDGLDLIDVEPAVKPPPGPPPP